MPNILYCAHCDGALMHRHVEDTDIFVCPICSAVYSKDNEKYHYLGKMSGGVSAKELLNNLADIQKMSS